MPNIKGVRVKGVDYDIRDAQTINDIVAFPYDSTQTYEVGNYCIYDLKLYKCIVAIETPEEWDDTHWTLVTICGEIVASAYSLPLASTTTRGGVKTGYTTDSANRNYAVQLTDEKMFVNVPWSNTTYADLGGATASADGSKGLVPQPNAGDQSKYLCGDGTWQTIETTDTKNTAGATDTSNKIFLVGATSQSANPQTYSHDTAYVGTDGCLYSGGVKVLTAHQDISGKANDNAVVHLTGAETIGGMKTFTTSPVLKNSTNPNIAFCGTGNDTPSSAILYSGASISGGGYTTGKFQFLEWSPNTSGTAILNTYEQYELPNVDRNRSGNATYKIITTKNLSDISGVVHTTNNETIGGTKTFTATPTINLTSITPVAGSQYNVLTTKFKNSDSSSTYTESPIRIIGNSETGGAVNQCGIALGSTSGATMVGAGESSAYFPSTAGISNTENLYLVSDSSVYIYPDVSNTGVVKGRYEFPSININANMAKAVKSISRSTTTFTVTCMDGTTFTFNQQDSNTTYTTFTSSANGLVPKSGGGTTKYLRADGTWVAPPNTNTWRGYQIKAYNQTYTCAGNTYTTLTANQLGISAISGYVPAAVLRFTTGHGNITIDGFQFNESGSTWVVRLRNVSSSSATGRAYVSLLWLQTG